MKKSVHFSSASDNWETPHFLFKQLDDEFGFNLDAAASEKNHKCELFYDEERSGLKHSWGHYTVWLNPPYSRGKQAAFIRKAYSESEKGATVVCLIPARPDTKIWHEVIFPNAEVRWLKGRISFVGAKASAPFPSAIVIFRPPPNIRIKQFQRTLDGFTSPARHTPQ